MMKLRPLHGADLPFVERWLADGIKEGYFAGELTELSAENLLSHAIFGEDLFLAITEEDRFLGITGLKDITEDRAEFFIGLLPEARRQGYGKQAARKVTDMALSEIALREIYMFTFKSNRATQAFDLAMGFEPWEGDFPEYEGRPVVWFRKRK